MGYLAVDHCPSKVEKKRRPGAGVYLRALVVESDPPGARPPALGASSVIAQRDPCYRLEIEAVMIGDADALSLLSAGRHVDK